MGRLAFVGKNISLEEDQMVEKEEKGVEFFSVLLLTEKLFGI